MTRWFLSYHSPDQRLAERLKAAIERKDPATSVFFAPSGLRAGGAWTAQLAQELAKADAFLLLIGEHGVGKWQVPEYDEALDRWVKSGRTFPLVVVLARRADSARTAFPAPVALDRHAPTRPPKKTSRASSTARPAAARARQSSGAMRLPIAASKPWRRRTAIISSAGRGKRSRRSRRSQRRAGCRCLIGNSGVGKSSLAQAGVLAALKRQAWPGKARAADAMAGGVSKQPPVVLSDAEARRRSDQGAGRMLSRRLAVRGGRPEAREAAAWLDRAVAGRGGRPRPDRRHRAPPRGTRSTQAAGLLSSTSIRARSFTRAPRKQSAGASPNSSPRRWPTRACA